MVFTFVGLTPQAVGNLPTNDFSHLSAATLSQLTKAQAAYLSGAQIDAIDAAAFAGFTKAALGALSAAALAAISPATAALFTAVQIPAISPASLAAMPPANFAALRPGEANGLTAAQIKALSPQQIAALVPKSFVWLSSNAIAALSATQTAALTAQQVAAFTGAQLNHFNADALNAAPLSSLSQTQIADLGAATIGRLSMSLFDALLIPHLAWLVAAQAAGLTLAQIASLSAAEVRSLRPGVIGALSAAQFDAFTPAAIAALAPTQLLCASAADFNSLSRAELEGLGVSGFSQGAIAGLSGKTLNALSPSQLAEFTETQVRALNEWQIAALTPVNLEALNPLYFGAAEVPGLPGAFIARLSVSNFDKAIAPYVADLTPGAINAITYEQFESLTSAEIDSFSPSQFDAMSAWQQSFMVAHGAVEQEAASLEVNGSLSYSGMLEWLQNEAAGGMNALKFEGLQAVVGALNTNGGIATSSYLAQIARDVVDGNSANAYWNGGSSTATALGDLTAGSSQAQMEELIGKWFLGTDLPSLYLPSAAGTAVDDQYQVLNLPLFGPSGPSQLDVNQGDVGDCYFLAALGETAYLDPSLIENMIQENPNGTYSVCFQVGGQADYVTVNNQLPVMTSDVAPDGSNMQFDNSTSLWSPLVEKAYAQLMEQTNVTPGATLGVNQDSYAATSGGWGNGISALTGQNAQWIGLESGEPAGYLADLANYLADALNNHLDVLAATSTLENGIGNLVNDHMFDVLQVNVAQQTLLLQNPWNEDVAGSGKAAQFTESLSALAADSNGYFDPSGFYVAVKA